MNVPLGDRSYGVVIGEGAVAELAAVLPASAKRVAVVTQPGIPLEVSLPDHAVETYVIGDGESAKSLSTIETLVRGFARQGLTRRDVVVGVGGGMVTDVAGFAAACWHRGTPVVHVSTTLLGMVDAAIGGKTGINTAEGKNLVGSFHTPAGVVCDLDVLSTLPQADLVAGLAEVLKGGFIADPRILELVEAAPQDAVRWDAPVLDELVRRKVAVKAEVVAGDLRE
ncbi:MAG: 3-dehydroquinate synthase family protein, partial [Acidobacteriota bacterium]